MWETLSLPCMACIEEAWAAYRAGSIPIGACITDAAGNIVARGRNRLHDDDCNNDLFCIQRHEFAHAEMNALLQLKADSQETRRDFVLHTTTEPCPLCLGAWYMSGVRNLRYMARDPWAGSVNILNTTWYMGRKAVQVTGPESPELETVVVALHVEFTLRTWSEAVTNEFLGRWRGVLPDGVRLGETLFRENLLEKLAASGADAREMTRRVAETAGFDAAPAV